MGEIANIDNNCSIAKSENLRLEEQCEIVAVSENMLAEVRASISGSNTLSMPIAEIVTLGAGVSSLFPSLRTVTQTMTSNTNGLYQLANQLNGDVLKSARDGTKWGSLKTAEGSSKLVKLQEVDSVTSTSKAVVAINPATLMMAVALFSIEQQLGKIEEMEKQIISFLEIEKESEIEADVESLTSIINKYKHNWDNEYFINLSMA